MSTLKSAGLMPVVIGWSSKVGNEDEKTLHRLLWDYGPMTNRDLAAMLDIDQRRVDRVMASLARRKFADVIYLSDGTCRKLWWAKSSTKIPWVLPSYTGYSDVKPSARLLSVRRLVILDLVIQAEQVLYEKYSLNSESFDYDIFLPRRFSLVRLPRGHQPDMIVWIKRWDERYEEWRHSYFYIEYMYTISSKGFLQKVVKSIQDRYAQYGMSAWPQRKTIIAFDDSFNLDRVESIFRKPLGLSTFLESFDYCYQHRLHDILLRGHK